MGRIAQRGLKAGMAAALAVFAAAHGQAAPSKAPTGRDSERAVSAIRSVERIGSAPVIRPDMPGLEGDLGTNIDGPSIIKVPSWIRNPLGEYYMYFAHHRGEYIRLAYADQPEGPWTIYKPGTLQLTQTSAMHHIASPDVVVDEEHKRLLLYYHGPTEQPGGNYGGRPYQQKSFVATSDNGLEFKAASGAIAPPYMKAFTYRGQTFGLAMADKASAYPTWLRSGQFLRSGNGIVPFEPGPRIIDEMRHAALAVRGDTLHIFYTVVRDRPERILYATVDLRPDWREWTASAPVEVLRPERKYEGADVPIVSSKGGMSVTRENALRDPGVLDENGLFYLYYSVAGENGIGLARVRLNSGTVSAK